MEIKCQSCGAVLRERDFIVFDSGLDDNTMVLEMACWNCSWKLEVLVPVFEEELVRGTETVI